MNKDQLLVWSNFTWKQMLSSAKNKNKLEAEDIKKIWNSFIILRKYDDFDQFQNLKVTGNISTGWTDQNIGGPLFQESLNKVMTSWENWTPAEYIIQYYLDCKILYPQIHVYELGRALRNLPSFLREYFLHNSLCSEGINSTIPSPENNATSHIDLEISHIGNTYTVWHYLDTDKGIFNLKKKLSVRGKIHQGKNLLIPLNLDRDSENYLGWKLPKNTYVKNIIKFIQSDQIITYTDFIKNHSNNFNLKNMILFSYP